MFLTSCKNRTKSWKDWKRSTKNIKKIKSFINYHNWKRISGLKEIDVKSLKK